MNYKPVINDGIWIFPNRYKEFFEMAKPAPNPSPTDDEGWETVETGLGEEWDFDKNGPLVGTIIGTREVDLPEHKWTEQADGIRKTAKAWTFQTGDTGEEVFLWESYQLTEKLKDVGTGDAVRIFFEGMREIDGGRRRVKQYKVQTRKS